MAGDSTRIPRTTTEASETVPPAAVRDVSGWINHLVRALKTCRLYDGNNPTVVRFREELHQGLKELLDRLGPVKLEVTSREILYEGASVYLARSRDDNLSGTFHRDGIHTLTFFPGVEAREIDAFLDQILRVTGPAADDDDLVTLLWEQNLPSLAVEAVPFEGDVDGAGADEADEPAPTPWPGATSGGEAAPAPGATGSRSDDWHIAEDPGDVDSAFSGLEASAPTESVRFKTEYDAELQLPIVTGMVEVLADALGVASAEDRAELGRFLPRVLREAITLGEWAAARKLLAQMRGCDPQWSTETFFASLATASDLVTRKAVSALDRQSDEEVAEFLELAADLGTGAVEWLMVVLAESQQKRARRPLARSIAMLVKEEPQRVLRWLSDPRWYVVRNVVHILGWIGGDPVSGYLNAVATHPEMRVRREALATLSQCSPAIARPILLTMLESAEPRLFTIILQQLSLIADPEVATRLVALLRDEHFHDRSEDERRAVFMALAAQGDPVLARLEEELNRGGRFGQSLDFHWQSLALCIARIGTPSALRVLDRGLKSPKTGIRKACQLARSMKEAA